MKLNKNDKIAIANFRRARTNGELFSKALWTPETTLELIKHKLCGIVVKHQVDIRLSTNQMADLLGVSAAKTKLILNYRIERLTIDELIPVVETVLGRPLLELPVSDSPLAPLKTVSKKP